MGAIDRRLVPRYEVHKHISVKYAEHMSIAKLSDLSLAGACVYLTDRLEPDTSILVTLDFSDILLDCRMTLQGLVVWNQDYYTEYQHGVFFSYINDQDLDKLSRVIHKLESAA